MGIMVHSDCPYSVVSSVGAIAVGAIAVGAIAVGATGSGSGVFTESTTPCVVNPRTIPLVNQ